MIKRSRGGHYGQDNPRDQIVCILSGALGMGTNILEGISPQEKLDEHVVDKIREALELLREYPDLTTWDSFRRWR